MRFKTKPTIHQRINAKMIQLLDQYLVTKHPVLKKIVPTHLKGRGRFNTCYDFPRPLPPLDMINGYINGRGEKLKTYLKHNIQDHSYLRVDLYQSQTGTMNHFSLVKERPDDYESMERTGVVRFVETRNVRLK